MKTCSRCNLTKPLTDFYQRRWDNMCKKCHSQAVMSNPNYLINKKLYRQNHKEHIKQYNDNYNNSLEKRMKLWKNGAIKRGIEWSLSLEDLKSIPLVCHYTGISLVYKAGQLNTISLDRVDNNKGYILNNVVFCCKDINIMKNTLDSQHFIQMCKMVSSYNEV